MPKDVAPAKRKARATDEPAPLYDNTTRGYLSTRTPAPAVTASNVSTRRLVVRSRLIPALSTPLLGTFDEAIYARPTDFDNDNYDHTGPGHDPSVPAVIQSELPGVTIKQVRSKRYLNSVRSYFSIIAAVWILTILCMFRMYLLPLGPSTVTNILTN